MSAEPLRTARRCLRCLVLGSPVEHSLSPVLHRAAYAALGLDWTYDADEVVVAHLGNYVHGLGPDVQGLSLTMPLKVAAVDLCAEVSATGGLLRSVNTMVRRPDLEWAGHNTDVPGVVTALTEAGVDSVGSAVIVGSGATAASALAAVSALGAAKAMVLARTPDKASRLVDIGAALDISVSVGPLAAAPGSTAGSTAGAAAGSDAGAGAGAVDASADVLISTIPPDAQAAYASRLAELAPVVFDVIYHPARTPLLAAAEEGGTRTVPGFALLLHQAARQVELMTGCSEAPVEAMRTAGLAALATRS
jgi:shikimate dehydrogenase